MELKEINIGLMIETGVAERGIEMGRICNFFNSTEEDILQMYKSNDLDTKTLLRWSKLLEYDFFRLYSQHLILYAPVSSRNHNKIDRKKNKSSLPQFRKNIYTKEIIEFMLGRISKGEMTRLQIIDEYKIPKTTLYKWMSKYGEMINNKENTES
ncbi:transposase [Chryseobacterium sp. SIMBA_038]|uniref:transposase n=1 Tax=Chryseobacterium sp. SIMBA_038 TaxID=3085780 RepID=UPI00397AB863